MYSVMAIFKSSVVGDCSNTLEFFIAQRLFDHSVYIYIYIYIYIYLSVCVWLLVSLQETWIITLNFLLKFKGNSNVLLRSSVGVTPFIIQFTWRCSRVTYHNTVTTDSSNGLHCLTLNCSRWCILYTNLSYFCLTSIYLNLSAASTIYPQLDSLQR
jgi:hypothetical protein